MGRSGQVSVSRPTTLEALSAEVSGDSDKNTTHAGHTVIF